MSDNEQSIIDSSKPNAGRIYDYLLGGKNNFKIDRQTAEYFLTLAPFASKMAKLVRWFLQTSIRLSIKWHFTQFLDFASGLPTEDHIHNNTPPGTKVIYSDIDPITVQHGKELIGENPDAKYLVCNAGNPETILQQDIVKNFFKDNHKAAIGYNGIFYFLTDDQVRHAMEILYDWADEGSILYFTDMDFESITNPMRKIMDTYKNMNQYIGGRSKVELKKLITPWQIKEPGFMTLEEWLGWDPSVTNDVIKSFGGGGFYGGFLIK